MGVWRCAVIAAVPGIEIKLRIRSMLDDPGGAPRLKRTQMIPNGYDMDK